MRLALACDRERLARTAPSPEWPVVWPSGELAGVLPSTESGEVVLPNSVNWTGNVEDGALIDLRFWPRVAAPLRRERIELVEVQPCHAASSARAWAIAWFNCVACKPDCPDISG